MGFRGFDSSIILILRGGIPRPIGNFPEEIESTNLSRHNLRREIGRSATQDGWAPGQEAQQAPDAQDAQRVVGDGLPTSLSYNIMYYY